MMKKNILLLSILLFSFSATFSQQVVFEQDVNKDTIVPTKGPNLKNFSHLYFGFGLVLGSPDSTGSDINMGSSTDFIIGYRYKRKLSNFYAIGVDISYGATSFNLKQDSSKLLPSKELHDKEKINSNQLGLNLYNRFNFGKRGNHVGKFLDLGAYGHYTFNYKHIFKDQNEIANSLHSSATKVVNTGLVYTNPLNYGVQARIGVNRYVLYGSYRLSDQFKANYGFPELPRLIVGFQIGLHG